MTGSGGNWRERGRKAAGPRDQGPRKQRCETGGIPGRTRLRDAGKHADPGPSAPFGGTAKAASAAGPATTSGAPGFAPVRDLPSPAQPSPPGAPLPVPPGRGAGLPAERPLVFPVHLLQPPHRGNAALSSWMFSRRHQRQLPRGRHRVLQRPSRRRPRHCRRRNRLGGRPPDRRTFTVIIAVGRLGYFPLSSSDASPKLRIRTG